MLDYGSQTKDLVNSIETLKGCLGLSEPYTRIHLLLQYGAMRKHSA